MVYLSKSSLVMTALVCKLYLHYSRHQEMLSGLVVWVSEKGLTAPDWYVTLPSLSIIAGFFTRIYSVSLTGSCQSHLLSLP